MSNVKVKINYSTSGKANFLAYQTGFEDYMNNISLLDGLTRKGVKGKPFLLNYSRLDGNSNFSNQYDGAILDEVSRLNGNCNFSFLVPKKVGTIDLAFFTIQFDSNFGYAKEIKVILTDENYNTEEHTFSNDKNFAIIKIPYTSGVNYINTIQIQITSWSKPNTPIVIDYLGFNEATEIYGASEIKDLTFGRQMTTDNENQPSFGLLSQYGSLKLFDINGHILEYQKNGFLDNKCSLEVFFYERRKAVLRTKRWRYDSKEKVFNIELSDRTEEFQNASVPTPVFTTVNLTALDILDPLMVRTSVVVNNEELRERLLNIKSTKTQILDQNLLSAINEWCEFTQTCIVLNANDELEVIDNV